MPPWEKYQQGASAKEPWKKYAEATAPQEPERSLPAEAGRQAGLTARYALEGPLSIPMMVGDAANTIVNYGSKGVNKITGSNIPMLGMPSAAVAGILDRAGFPNPENGLERVIGDAARSVASVPTFAQTAAVSGVRALEPLTRNLGTQAVSAATSGASMGGAREAGLPVWAQLAAGLGGGMLGGVRVAPNRAAAQRVEDFRTSGIRASAPDVTQSATLQRAQKVTEATPLSGDYVRAQETARSAQAQQQAGRISEGYGTAGTPQGVGQATQDAVARYRFGARPEGMTDREVLVQPTRNSSIAAKAGVLYDRVPLAAGDVVEVDRTRTAVQNAAAKFGNPELSGEFGDPRMNRLTGILERAGNLMTWEDLRNLRTEIRYLRGQARLDPTIDDRALNQIDTALSEDMVNGARVHGGDRAVQLVQRADQYYARSMARVNDSLRSVFGAAKPEAAFTQIESAMSAKASKSDINKLASLRRALSPEEWGDLSATIVDRLGRPNPGAVGAPDAPPFSVNQFVTRYADISPDARNLLFDGAGRQELRRQLDALNRAAGNMKQTDRVTNNSQSGNQAIGAGALGGMYVAPTTTATLILGANIGARALYNPAFVRLMTLSIRAATPEARTAAAAQITRFASQNPQLSNDAGQLLKALVPARADSDQETR